MDQTKLMIGIMMGLIVMLAAADVPFITSNMKKKYTDASVAKYNRAALAGELLFISGFLVQGTYEPEWMGWLLMVVGAALCIGLMKILKKR